MDLLFHPIFLEHDTGMHPENRKRLDAFLNIKPSHIPFNEAILKLIHSQQYIDNVISHCETKQTLDGETHISKNSYKAAVYAANATILAYENNDFALVRPPGHHAYPDRASGFCIFNNVAIAAQKLVNEGKKVLIFDFDGHLGDGTSEIFYESDQVFYWSIHQFPAFPGHGSSEEIGRGNGKGYTMNVPLLPYSGDDIFWDAIQYTLPIVKQFKPDVVAVSAGFDSHQYDLLLDLRLTLDTYYKLGQLLRNNFEHVFATLEGGYNIKEIPKCIFNFIDGFNGRKKLYTERQTESDIKIWHEYELRLDDLLSSLHPYWKI